MADSGDGCDCPSRRRYPLFFTDRVYSASGVRHLSALHGVYAGPCLYTLKHDGHVRVDIFYRGYSAKTKALVNFVGGVLFLLPLCCLLFFVSWDYVLASWAIRRPQQKTTAYLLYIYSKL